MSEIKDLNDYFKHHQKSAFDKLVSQSKNIVEYKVGAFKEKELSGIELNDAIRDELIPFLSGLDELDRDSCLGYLQQKLNLSKRAVSNSIKRWEEGEEKRQAKEEMLKPAVEIDTNALQLRQINLAQDFIDGIAYYTVYLPTNTGKEIPFLITSDREAIILHSVDSLTQRGLVPPERQVRERWVDEGVERVIIPPNNYRRWQTVKEINCSVIQYLEGTAHVDPVELYLAIRRVFDTYLEYPEDAYYDFISCWVIGTYLFMMFDAYGYGAVTGSKRTGKTLTLEILSELCFNAVMNASISTAAIFRSVEQDRCTILYDEAELMSFRQKNDVSEKFEILQSGYKRSGYVMRCDGEEMAPTRFSTYSPKFLANIRGLEDVMEDRCIVMHLMRKGKKSIKRFSLRQEKQHFAALRNQLYVFALEYHEAILEEYENLPEIEAIDDRQVEMWSPLLAIARFIDKKSENPVIFDILVAMARENKEDREFRDNEEQPESRVIKGLWEYINSTKSLSEQTKKSEHDNLYLVSEVYERVIKSSSELSWISKRFLGKLLRNLNLISHPKTDAVTVYFGGRQQLCYRLLPERILEVAERYQVHLDKPESVSEILEDVETPDEQQEFVAV